MIFNDRRDAGRKLAAALHHFSGQPGVVVLGLPRGGVPVAYEVAQSLEVPLDLFIVRKLGVPGHEEYAMGAVASGGGVVLNDEAVQSLRIPDSILTRAIERERAEIVRREKMFRGNRPPLDVTGKTVILVDDGLATGSTMRVAIEALRKKTPGKIVVAVPVGAQSTCHQLEALADELICLATPEPFDAVGLWYRDFSQTTDAEVQQLLDRTRSSKHDEALTI